MDYLTYVFLCLSKNEYIMPILLSPERPEINWAQSGSLKFEYEYEFMPTGIMTKFIARNHKVLGAKSQFWKHGVFLVSDESETLIEESRNKKKITIQIRGTGDKRAYLVWLRHEIENINHAYNQLKVKQLIPCNCERCAGKADPYLHEYDYLPRTKRRRNKN